jgi:hypothetical protein
VEEAGNWVREELDHGKYRCRRRCLATQFEIIDHACDDNELPEALAAHFEGTSREDEQLSKRAKVEYS